MLYKIFYLLVKEKKNNVSLSLINLVWFYIGVWFVL